MGMVASRLLGELTLLTTLLISLVRSGLISEIFAIGSPVLVLRPGEKG
jgi:PST family polysaccharide transporter